MTTVTEMAFGTRRIAANIAKLPELSRSTLLWPRAVIPGVSAICPSDGLPLSAQPLAISMIFAALASSRTNSCSAAFRAATAAVVRRGNVGSHFDCGGL